MSEVRRTTTWFPNELGGSMLESVVRASDYDAALSEMAALREELEAEKQRYVRDVDEADEETSALRECIRDLKDWREHSQSLYAFALIISRAEAVIPAPGPLRKALTAAEQRNAALVELLRDIRDAPGGSSFNKHIDALLAQPTESGASE